MGLRRLLRRWLSPSATPSAPLVGTQAEGRESGEVMLSVGDMIKEEIEYQSKFYDEMGEEWLIEALDDAFEYWIYRGDRDE